MLVLVTDLTADWSLPGTRDSTMRRLHSWISAVFTLAGALLITVSIIAFVYCKVQRLHKTTNHDDSQLQYVNYFCTLLLPSVKTKLPVFTGSS